MATKKFVAPSRAKGQLIAIATKYLWQILRRKGTVTSVEVLARMRASGIDMSGHDPRWIGHAFRDAGLKRVRFARIGSHGRPVSVWAQKEAA